MEAQYLGDALDVVSSLMARWLNSARLSVAYRALSAHRLDLNVPKSLGCTFMGLARKWHPLLKQADEIRCRLVEIR